FLSLTENKKLLPVYFKVALKLFYRYWFVVFSTVPQKKFPFFQLIFYQSKPKENNMLAMNFIGPFRVRADRDRPYPEIEHPEDAIVRVLRTCICGSDLHLYHGLVPDTRVGSTFGHEFIGEVVEIGSAVEKLTVGDRVMVPFNIACG